MHLTKNGMRTLCAIETTVTSLLVLFDNSTLTKPSGSPVDEQLRLVAKHLGCHGPETAGSRWRHFGQHIGDTAGYLGDLRPENSAPHSNGYKSVIAVKMQHAVQDWRAGRVAIVGARVAAWNSR